MFFRGSACLDRTTRVRLIIIIIIIIIINSKIAAIQKWLNFNTNITRYLRRHKNLGQIGCNWAY